MEYRVVVFIGDGIPDDTGRNEVLAGSFDEVEGPAKPEQIDIMLKLFLRHCDLLLLNENAGETIGEHVGGSIYTF